MELIGKITHWFDKIDVAVIKLEKPLKVGDKIKVGDDDDSFEQEVKSMQVDHKEITEANAGDEIGMKLEQKTRKDTTVYLV